MKYDKTKYVNKILYTLGNKEFSSLIRFVKQPDTDEYNKTTEDLIENIKKTYKYINIVPKEHLSKEFIKSVIAINEFKKCFKISVRESKNFNDEYEKYNNGHYDGVDFCKYILADLNDDWQTNKYLPKHLFEVSEKKLKEVKNVLKEHSQYMYHKSSLKFEIEKRDKFLRKINETISALKEVNIEDDVIKLVHKIIIDNVDENNFNELHSDFFIEKFQLDKQENKDLIISYLEKMNELTVLIESEIIDNTRYHDLYDDSDNVDHSVQEAVISVIKEEAEYSDYLWDLGYNVELYEKEIQRFNDNNGREWYRIDFENFEMDTSTIELFNGILKKIYDAQYLWELEYRFDRLKNEHDFAKKIYAEYFPKAFDAFKNELINEAETYYKENKRNFDGYDFTDSVNDFEICYEYETSSKPYTKTYIIENEAITANDEIIDYIENKIKKEIFKDPDIQDIEENGKAYFERKHMEENLRNF